MENPMTSNQLPSNGREVISEVLLKLAPSVLPKLPMACKTCPHAAWQITGKPERPEAVTVRCYCPRMHTFTWDSRTQEEILDCDFLYDVEDEEEAPQSDPEDVPAFLRQQQQVPAPAAPEHEKPVPEHEHHELET
jgi:hypothetical protein